MYTFTSLFLVVFDAMCPQRKTKDYFRDDKYCKNFFQASDSVN